MAYMMKFPRQNKTKLGGETMKDNKSGKVIAIAALVVAVVALSVGFAAFTDVLDISGTATAGASGNVFDAGTDGANGLRYTGTPTCVYTNDSSAVPNVNVGTFTNNNDSWSGISVPLGSTATSVTCTATVTNSSSYIAHITDLKTSGPLTCSSSGANTLANETNVCGATTVTATISDGTNSDTLQITNSTAANATSTTRTAEVAANGGTATVTVVIAYAGADADADTTITLPTITHYYSSAGHTGE